MSLLHVSHLRKSYNGHVAVDDLSFHVDAGEVFGLLGPNGAGKSTTMMMLAGLLTPDGGTIRLNDHSFTLSDRSLRMLLGVVPQELAVYPDLTTWENLDFFGSLYGLRGAELRDRIEESLRRTGLDKHAHQVVRTFSGGMKRRLNFGIALLHRPRLLILDEPTVGVDPQSRSHLLESIRELSREGMAVIYASHYMEEVQAICRRVGIMDQGRLLAYGGLTELLGQLRSDLRLRLSHCSPELIGRLGGFDGAALMEGTPPTLVLAPSSQAEAADLNRIVREAVDLLDACGVRLVSIESQEPNLERLFLQLTGNRLRD